jgi:hypothetical protein
MIGEETLVAFWNLRMYEENPRTAQRKLSYETNTSLPDACKYQKYCESIPQYREVQCVKVKDVTRYYITNPIKITPREMEEYTEVKFYCGVCKECGESYVNTPIIFEKDGRYYIYAESVTASKNKNDCNTYKEVKMRLYPIYKVDVNTNENCVVYK